MPMTHAQAVRAGEKAAVHADETRKARDGFREANAKSRRTQFTRLLELAKTRISAEVC